MKTSIEFRKTGNFWLDNGLVAMYQLLNEVEVERDVPLEVELDDHKVIVRSTSDGNDITLGLHALNLAKAKAVKRYLLETPNFGWTFANFKFEVYPKTDFSMALKPFFIGKTGKPEHGALCVPPNKETIEQYLTQSGIPYAIKKENIELTGQKFKKGNREFYLTMPISKPNDMGSKGREMNAEEVAQFVSFLLANHEIKLAGKGYLISKPKYEIGEEFSEEFLKNGKKTCAFSGEKVKSAATVTGMDYPFLTGTSGELNFASFLCSKPQISAKYAFVGVFSFYNLRYVLQNDFANYFMVYDPDLDKLRRFLKSFPIPAELLNSRRLQFCNFNNEVFGAQYEAESLMSFTLALYQSIRSEMRRDDLLTKTIFTFGNDGNIFREVREYTKIAALFEFFGRLFEEEHWLHFKNMLQHFSEKKGEEKYDTTWRNRLCDKILNFRPIATTLEQFLGTVRMRDGGGIPYLDSIISIYHQTIQSDMKEETVKMCQNVGRLIGQYCQISDDKGILFSIRNARNRTDFLKTLSLAQFKMGDDKKFPDEQKQWISAHFSPKFFEGIPEDELWEEYKALVSIFAMNSFLYRKQSSTPETTTANN